MPSHAVAIISEYKYTRVSKKVNLYAFRVCIMRVFE
ncbi:hypothetical protein EMIT0P265_50035 [Pseudomonas zeae]